MRLHEPQIFICYRRHDSNPAARGIYERLKVAFGESAVFLDHFDFNAGEDWRQKTRPVVGNARAVVVVIHKDWLSIARDRFRDVNDPVRQELELARDRPDVLVVPVTIDGTRLPNESEIEAFRSVGDPTVVNLMSWLFAKTALTVRFDHSFEADIQRLVKTLDAHPGIDLAGHATSIDVGGLRVVRPWAATAARPETRSGDERASDLWILQAKYRAIPLVGRESDLDSLRSWLESDRSISARLIVGRAGAGKTRVGLEFLWEVFRDRGDRWDAGVVVRESFHQPRDWHGWTWPRPTLLMIDYAHAVEGTLAQMLLALGDRAQDVSLPPLRLLLLEREGSATKGWFHRLIERDSDIGGGSVRDLFEPAHPVVLAPLETMDQRRSILAYTLALAEAHDGRVTPRVPAEGDDRAFDDRMRDSQWRDPLYLMMAALVARQRWHADRTTGLNFLEGLSLGRTDLAVELARKERRRLDRFVPQQEDGPRRLFGHLAACATFGGGFSATEARLVAEDETAALGLTWLAGPGDLVARLHEALPQDDQGIAAVQPDIVGEALILTTWLPDGLSHHQQRDVIHRLAQRRPSATAAALFRTVQDFAADNQRINAIVDWAEALVGFGLEGNVTTLLAIEAALPKQTTVLRDAALRVTESLYQRLQSAASRDGATLDAEIARLAHNLAIRLSEMERRTEAIAPAEKAVALYRELAAQNPNDFLPPLATALNTLVMVLSDVGRRPDVLALANDAVGIHRLLATENPADFLPALGMSLHNLGTILSRFGRLMEALGAVDEAVAIRRDLAAQDPTAFRPALAISLMSQGAILSAAKRYADGIALAEEAVALYRALATQNPDAFRPALAGSLSNLADRLSEVGRRTDALGFATEAVALHRTLAAQNRAAFQPSLAKALISLSLMLMSEVGRQADAIVFAEEAVVLYRELPGQDPAGFPPDLARALNTLAIALSEVGRNTEAIAPAEEAVALYRALAAQNPVVFKPLLARALGISGSVFERNDRPGDAFTRFHEGISALAPDFLARPEAFDGPVIALLGDYRRIAETLAHAPDAELLGPIDDALSTLKDKRRRSDSDEPRG